MSEEKIMPLTPEWHAARKTCIGASEAAAVLGLSPYSTPLEIYARKRGEIPDQEENDAMRLGTLLEPVVLSEYERRTGCQLLRPVPLMLHQETPFIGATPDAMRPDPDCPGDDWAFPVDAKTTTFRRAAEFGEEGTDQLPVEYLCQAAQQMYVTGADRCDIAVLIDGRTLRIYTVARHDGLIKHLVQAETELWRRIQEGDPPPLDFSHPRALEIVKALHGIDESSVADFSGMDAADWTAHQKLGEEIKGLEKERDRLKARVLHAMGEASVGRCAGFDWELVRQRVTRKEYVCKASEYVTLKQRKAK